MGLHGLSTEHRLYEMCMSWSSLMTKLPLLLTGCRTCARSWQRWKSERCLSFSSSVMSVELGLGISSSDILKHAMSREMGGWPYNDIWTQSLQNSASLPYTAGPGAFRRHAADARSAYVCISRQQVSLLGTP